MSNPSPTIDVGAMAFFNFAREYYRAANQLFDLNIEQTSRSPEAQNPIVLSRPVSFLYFHTAELLLKAFLRSQNLPIVGTSRQSHRLVELYQECRALGLKISDDDRFGIGKIVTLLESGNEDQAFRYFNRRSTATADLSWVREIIGQLLNAVEPHVRGCSEPTEGPGPAVALMAIYFKPSSKETS